MRAFNGEVAIAIAQMLLSRNVAAYPPGRVHRAMPPRKITRQRPTAAKLRSWRVIIIRSKGEYFGSVEAPDRERAQAVAIKQFALDNDQRSRLLIRERL